VKEKELDMAEDTQWYGANLDILNYL